MITCFVKLKYYFVLGAQPLIESYPGTLHLLEILPALKALVTPEQTQQRPEETHKIRPILETNRN